MTTKLEYDSCLGGPVVLGTHMPTYRYAASALKELKELVNASKQCNSNKLVFQTLPKHMRRRAMSHHPKRLPRKYRSAHVHQMSKSGKPQATKTPSRKHRRRPKNLLRDYLRRQKKHKWLETHIWHAKRFHMVERWGYKLPYASCDKTYRACYRASANHCLLQDISFYACVEIIGSLDELSLGFQKLTSKECGLSMTAKTYTTGRREGHIDVFKAESYPYHALGKVAFLWRYENTVNQSNEKRVLWLWIHPAAFNTILEEIIKVFNLKRVRKELVRGNRETIKKESVAANIKMKRQRRQQFVTKSTARQNITQYRNENESVELNDLKDTLNRFRLTGPLAQSILNCAFKVKSFSKDLGKEPSWVKDVNEYDINFSKYHAEQQQFWEKCKNSISSPSELLSNMILGLNIEDPRIHRPQKRTKAVNELKEENFNNSNEIIIDSQSVLSSSVLWNDKLRNRISTEMLSTHDYCSLRAKYAIVPGKPCQFEETLQPIPVILIQRPGLQDISSGRVGYGSGWDIIAPAGYGMPIWLSLIMWGARTGGLRELGSIAREMGTEEHLPDTVAGVHTASDRRNELCLKYFRLPPNKRCNYNKFAIVSPFRIPFQQLVRDWNFTNSSEVKEDGKFFVLRERQQLDNIAYCIKKCTLFKFPTNLSTQSLIQVKLTMKSRGNPKDFSVVCLPTKRDLKRNLKQVKSNNRGPVFVEPLLADPNEKERHQLRVQHKKLLKRLRAKRVREKRKKQETSCSKVFIRPAGTSALCLEHFKKICSLWLPQDTSTLFSVRKQATRECFGYASIANFCLTEGTVGAIGYITPQGLQHLLKLCQQCNMKQAICLIRSNNSRNYRFAKIQINLAI